MPKVLILVIFLLLVTPVNAATEVRVNISGNLDGSTNKVQINSNTETVQQSPNNNYNNSTSVRIEQNGQVKEYNGSDGNVNIRSSDGKSSVSVSNDFVEDTNQTSYTNTPFASESGDATAAGIFKESEIDGQDSTGFWENLLKRLNAIFEKIL